ncbi:MAG TPA: hypothetical protein VFI46_10715 [Jiangellaceae bacterium]|nr:hypothetical protein [Jiangellaceae bacterium]
MITTQDLFPDRFVKITKSVCFGDSGGRAEHAAPWHSITSTMTSGPGAPRPGKDLPAADLHPPHTP